MGQRNQLQWDIPVLDSYRLNQAVFRIPDADFKARVDELTELVAPHLLLQRHGHRPALGQGGEPAAQVVTVP